MIPGWFKKSNISQKTFWWDKPKKPWCDTPKTGEKGSVFLRKTKGSLAGKLASKKYDIIIAQALSKLRESIDVLKTNF